MIEVIYIGRRILGEIQSVGEVYAWHARSGDAGVTDTRRRAIARVVSSFADGCLSDDWYDARAAAAATAQKRDDERIALAQGLLLAAVKTVVKQREPWIEIGRGRGDGEDFHSDG